MSLSLKPKQPEKFSRSRDQQAVISWITSVDSYFCLTNATPPNVYHYFSLYRSSPALTSVSFRHFHLLFQLHLINPTNPSIALQINSGTFVLVMLQQLCFASSRTSDRPTIRLAVSSAFERNKPTNCSIRQKAKFPAYSNESTLICGPFPTSKGLMKLLLTFLDEYSHWCWIVTIDDKSSATVNREFRQLIKQIETETELKIKYLRADGGSEYEGDLTPVLSEMGIQHEPTVPYSPQSNGKAERLNRTLKTFTRAKLYQANMPKSFWAEALTTAAYLINRLPSEAINKEIPYEKWHQNQLPISDLRALKPFGCIFHIFVPEERQKANSKVHTQATTACFVGSYTNTTNTMWRVYDFERKLSRVTTSPFSRPNSQRHRTSTNHLRIPTIVPHHLQN